METSGFLIILIVLFAFALIISILFAKSLIQNRKLENELLDIKVKLNISQHTPNDVEKWKYKQFIANCMYAEVKLKDGTIFSSYIKESKISENREVFFMECVSDYGVDYSCRFMVTEIVSIKIFKSDVDYFNTVPL